MFNFRLFALPLICESEFGVHEAEIESISCTAMDWLSCIQFSIAIAFALFVVSLRHPSSLFRNEEFVKTRSRVLQSAAGLRTRRRVVSSSTSTATPP